MEGKIQSLDKRNQMLSEIAEAELASELPVFEFKSVQPHPDALRNFMEFTFPNSDTAYAVQPGGLENKPPAGKSVPIRFSDLANNTKWREYCIANHAGIPAGYTYLAQLLGHDIGSSLDLHESPYTICLSAEDWQKISTKMMLSGADEDGTKRVQLALDGSFARYNLIENPATLETVYGAGPRVLTHLFTPDFKFRVDPELRISKAICVSEDEEGKCKTIRAIYDQRNRDTPMLHELTTAWMFFHNMLMDQLSTSGLSVVQRYSVARSHAVRVWHNIIRGDLLPNLIMKEVNELKTDNLPSSWSLTEADLLHGLFRAFHSMPLQNYPIGISGGREPEPLHRLLRVSREDNRITFGPELNPKRWRINWPRFFGETGADTPITGINASVVNSFRISSHIILQKDQVTATDVGVVTLAHRAMEQAKESLEKVLGISDIANPAKMDDALKAKAQDTDVPELIAADVIRNGPLGFALSVEAQASGQNGRFGPLGSALLKASIEKVLNRVEFPLAGKSSFKLPEPKTMLQLIQSVRGE